MLRDTVLLATQIAIYAGPEACLEESLALRVRLACHVRVAALFVLALEADEGFHRRVRARLVEHGALVRVRTGGAAQAHRACAIGAAAVNIAHGAHRLGA